jgi:peptide/nickel transport system substrate-binding protein
MEREARTRFESWRYSLGPVQSQVIDDLNDGEFVDRQEFFRRASLLGLSVSAMSAALVAAGEAPVAFAKPEAGKAGGRLRAGIFAPSGPIEPHEFEDTGRTSVGSVTGEFLNRTLGSGVLAPELATSWTPNRNASVWTVKLRENVQFQSGQTFGPADVIATFKRLLDPKTSQAISAYQGVLSQGHVVKGAAANEVVFHLESPSVNFPYTLSSNTYQAIMLPADYQLGTFTKTAQTTGAFQITSYTPGVGASYDRFDGWWRGKAHLDGVDLTIYSDSASQDAALISGAIDLLGEQGVSLSSDRPLFHHPGIQIFRARSAAHTDYAMRVDYADFADPRVRQAVALTIDRPDFVKTLYGSFADLGNDHPFAPVFPTAVPIAQRAKNIRKAKALLAAAGKSAGFTVPFTVENANPIPASAEIIQAGAKEIGIHLDIKLETDSVFFAGTSTGPPKGWGTTPWLNDPMTATGWAHRAVPNVFLTSALQTKGIWNESHYSNKNVDAAIKSFLASIALKDQRKYAKQIEKQVQADTPVLYLAFTNLLDAGSTKVKGFSVMPASFYVSTVSLA